MAPYHKKGHPGVSSTRYSASWPIPTLPSQRAAYCPTRLSPHSHLCPAYPLQMPRSSPAYKVNLFQEASQCTSLTLQVQQLPWTPQPKDTWVFSPTSALRLAPNRIWSSLQRPDTSPNPASLGTPVPLLRANRTNPELSRFTVVHHKLKHLKSHSSHCSIHELMFPPNSHSMSHDGCFCVCFVVLAFEPRTSCMPGKFSATELHPSPTIMLIEVCVALCQGSLPHLRVSTPPNPVLTAGDLQKARQ